MSLNVTHPSVLDEDRLEYRLYLTPDLLPEMEELLLPGPLHEEIRVEVRGDPGLYRFLKYTWFIVCSIEKVMLEKPVLTAMVFFFL